MFADNEKISAVQLGRLLSLDWTAKLLLLLPVLLGELDGWAQPLAILTGAIFAWGYSVLLAGLYGKIEGSFTQYMKERLGKRAAQLAGWLFFTYLLLSEVYLSRAAGRTCQIFLLPEMKEEVIGALLLLAGAVTALGSVQKRARAAQCLYPVAAGLLILMAVASAGSVKPEYLQWDAPGVPEILRGGVCVFAVFAGLGLTLYEAPYVSQAGKRAGGAVKKALLRTAIFTMVLFVIMLGAFGSAQLRTLPWPVLVLMSNVNIPGGFLQRWDIIFLSVLLLSLFTAAGSGIHYMERILGELSPQTRKETRPWYAAGVSFAAMLITGNYETAEKIFAKWALCAAVPLTAALPILLWSLECVDAKRRKGDGKC